MFKNLIEKTQKIKALGWVKGVSNGTGNAGITFETLLGKARESFEIPDYDGIEIKTKSFGNEKYMTLFNATPDSYLFEIKRIHDTYGYPDKTHPEYRVFNVSIYSDKKCLVNHDVVAYLRVDQSKRVVSLCFENILTGEVDEETSWTFDLLEEKLLRKLQRLFIVRYLMRKNSNGVFFKYQNYDCYVLKDFDSFINAIEAGIVRVSFNIGVFKSGKRLGQIYDHGTSFSIQLKDLSKVFTRVN